MKGLILTCSTGQGHNSTAAAVRDGMEDAGIPCDIVDSLSFLSERTAEFISGWHTRIYRHIPRAFNTGYGFAEQHYLAPIAKYLGSGADNLRSLLINEGYDFIVCSHVFSSSLVTELRRRHGNFPTSLVATDYTCSPMAAESDVDLYFIPHEALRAEFRAAGIENERIIASGIPIRRSFNGRRSREDAKRELGIPESEKCVLLMGGSMGCGNIDELAETIASALPEDAILTVVCGTNEKLRAKMERLCLPNARIMGYTDKVPLLMDAASLFLTKPGGISITEASAKGVPLLLLDMVGGCEARNRDFFVSQGFAQVAGGSDRLPELIADILKRNERPVSGVPVDGAATVAREMQRLTESYDAGFWNNEAKEDAAC